MTLTMTDSLHGETIECTDIAEPDPTIEPAPPYEHTRTQKQDVAHDGPPPMPTIADMTREQLSLLAAHMDTNISLSSGLYRNLIDLIANIKIDIPDTRQKEKVLEALTSKQVMEFLQWAPRVHNVLRITAASCRYLLKLHKEGPARVRQHPGDPPRTAQADLAT